MFPVIQLQKITKKFGNVVANDRIDLGVRRGEIHAIVGENGAGKSTLVHSLSGLVKPDKGSILVEGEPLVLGKPDASLEAGIGLVAQHFSLVPTLTGWENIVLGCEPTTHWGSIDRRNAMRTAVSLAEKLDVSFPLDVPIESLPLANRQALEIIKALYRDAKFLILDEPTSSLSPPEAERLFQRLHSLADSGTTILLVTHKIQEVVDHADSATVLRHGRVTAGLKQGEMTSRGLVAAIMGDKEYTDVAGSPAVRKSSVTILAIEGLSVKAKDRKHIRNLNLTLVKGEILGVAGVAGNGQDYLFRSVLGIEQPTEGRIVYKGLDITRLSTRERRKLGIAVIPEDRLAEGIIPQLSLRDNLILGDHARFSRRFGLDIGEMGTFAQAAMRSFDIRADSHMQFVGNLSGGNQQKAVIARELSTDPDLLIAAQPARGLDLGAKAYVHTRLRQASDRGAGVLLISQDLDELVQLSHRIVVMNGGRIVGEQSHRSMNVSTLGQMMTGATES